MQCCSVRSPFQKVEGEYPYLRVKWTHLILVRPISRDRPWLTTGTREHGVGLLKVSEAVLPYFRSSRTMVARGQASAIQNTTSGSAFPCLPKKFLQRFDSSDHKIAFLFHRSCGITLFQPFDLLLLHFGKSSGRQNQSRGRISGVHLLIEPFCLLVLV